MKIYLVKVIVRYFLLLKRLQYIQQNAKFPAFLLERKYYYVSHFIIFLFFYGKEKRTRWDIGGGNKVERWRGMLLIADHSSLLVIYCLP